MFIKKHVSMEGDHMTRWFAAAGLALAILLFNGILYATPIMNPDSQLQDSRQLSNQTDTRAGGGAQLVSAPQAAHVVPAKVARRAPAGSCTFSSDCFHTVQVPEPQSLVMVGTGLLSMAGLLRRRLLR